MSSATLAWSTDGACCVAAAGAVGERDRRCAGVPLTIALAPNPMADDRDDGGAGRG